MQRWQTPTLTLTLALAGATLLAAACTAQAAPETEAAALAKKRMSAAVNGCYMSSGAADHAAGRVELFVQAHAGEVVNVVVHSELNNPDFTDCVCSRSASLLTPWGASVAQDESLSLPYILSPNSGQPGQTYPKSAHTCALTLTTTTTSPDTLTDTLPALDSLRPGRVQLSKLKAKGTDSAAAQAVLDRSWETVERCYRADLIRYQNYTTDDARLELLLAPDGSVSAARIEGVAHNSISNCQIQHLLGLSFPPADAPARIRARLAYTPGE